MLYLLSGALFPVPMRFSLCSSSQPTAFALVRSRHPPNMLCIRTVTSQLRAVVSSFLSRRDPSRSRRPHPEQRRRSWQKWRPRRRKRRRYVGGCCSPLAPPVTNSQTQIYLDLTSLLFSASMVGLKLQDRQAPSIPALVFVGHKSGYLVWHYDEWFSRRCEC